VRGAERTASGFCGLDERPRNANKLAETLELDDKTVRHHFDVLAENDIALSFYSLNRCSRRVQHGGSGPGVASDDT